MLTYHPSLDAYHCFFRMIYFLSRAENTAFEIDKMRIIDFYLSSPAALKYFKFPMELKNRRKIFSDKVNEYNKIPNQQSLFFEMQHIHKAVFDMLASIGLIDSEMLKKGSVYLLRDHLTNEISQVIENSSSIDQDISELAIKDLAQIPLLGVNGLKDRSGLMDHRYDLV
ncbi:MAG: ABC-three component system middle component 5 [Pseudomonadota bacterium]